MGDFIGDAILYQGKALDIWKEKIDLAKVADSLRFLSRLRWFEGNRERAEALGLVAVGVLENEPVSAIKAMAYSNMSQRIMPGRTATGFLA